MSVADDSKFVVRPRATLEDADGEAIAVAGDRVATFGSHQGTWWVDETPHTVELPGIPVRGARWSEDGAGLLVGTGVVDIAGKTFNAAPALEQLVTPPPPGHGSVVVYETSWSVDGSYAAALLKWEGPAPKNGPRPPERVVIFDLKSEAAPIEIPAERASHVRIVGDRAVVATPAISVWSFAGDLLAELPATPGAPLSISGGDDGGPLIIIDQDWSIRIVDTASGTVRAQWPGKFLDAVHLADGVIAIDYHGTLHAGCIEGPEVREVGTFDTGIRAAQLAAIDGKGLAILSGGQVQLMDVQLSCERTNDE